MVIVFPILQILCLVVGRQMASCRMHFHYYTNPAILSPMLSSSVHYSTVVDPWIPAQRARRVAFRSQQTIESACVEPALSVIRVAARRRSCLLAVLAGDAHEPASMFRLRVWKCARGSPQRRRFLPPGADLPRSLILHEIPRCAGSMEAGGGTRGCMLSRRLTRLPLW